MVSIVINMSMWFVVLFSFLAYGGYYTAIGAGDMVAKGTWSVLNTQRCEDYEQYKYDIELKRKRINRTHDAFDARLNCDAPVEPKFKLRAIIDKLVDGGYKLYQNVADDSFCGFVKKYAGSNMEDALTMAGVDPPDCPIPAGNWEILDFLFNYEELPEDGMPGEYQVNIFLVDEDEDVGCVFMNVKFEEKEEE